MLEVEIRARTSMDEGSLGATLTGLGYTGGGTVTQVDHIFDLPGAPRFLRGEKLRLRHEGDLSELTFKSNLTGSAAVSSRHEATIVLAGEQLAGCIDLMSGLGYELIFSLPKRRTTYLRGAVQVTLDVLPIIGLVIEIEGPQDEIELAAPELAPGVEFRNFRLKELTDQSLAESGLEFDEAVRRAEEAWNMQFGDLALALGIGR